MKKILIYCICVAVILLAANIFGRPESTNARSQAAGGGFTVAGGGVCKEGELLVRFAPKADGKQPGTAEKSQILTSLGGAAEKESFKIVPGLSLVKLPAGQKVEDALQTYNNTGGILYAGPNYKLQLMSTEPDDPYYKDGHLWGMHNTGQEGGTPGADIDAPEAWDISTGSSDIIVAHIDTGIDYTHEDLAANMWTNPVEEIGDKNGDGRPGVADVDDDGDGLIDEDSEDRQPGEQGYTNDLVDDDDENGYIDDIRGWNFYDDDNNTMDESANGHGTHLAGTIGAVGNNGIGVVGVCWDVKIMSLRIFGDPLDAPGVISSAIEAVQYAIDNGAKVLSNAYGYYKVDPPYGWPPFPEDYNQSFKDVIDAAGEAGLLFVDAAGNDGLNNDVCDIYPENYDCDNIIVVMATDRDDKRSDWGLGRSSNFGPNTVDLAAPGSAIYSCVPKRLVPLPPPWYYGPPYLSKNGTSCAQPHVAGACALLWSANPSLSHLQVKQIVLDTVDVIEDLEDDCVTGGRLNVYKAIHRACLYPGEGGFCIKDNSGEPVARFGDSGNLFLKGILTENTTPVAYDDFCEFRVQNSIGDDVAIIDGTDGNMYITGERHEGQDMSLLSPEGFIVKNSNGDVVAYIDDSGDEAGHLYLAGKLYQNPEP